MSEIECHSGMLLCQKRATLVCLCALFSRWRKRRKREECKIRRASSAIFRKS